MEDQPSPETLSILRDAMAALGPKELTKLSAAIKAASKTNLLNIRDVERVLREMGDATLTSDPTAAETFFTLSETLAEAREQYEKRNCRTLNS